MEFLFIFILFGIITAAVASNKGRSRFGWFLIGGLLGPFGLILALVVSKNTAEIEKTQLRSGELKKCPACAELIKREAVKCRYCGEPVDGSVTQDDTSPRAASDRFIQPK